MRKMEGAEKSKKVKKEKRSVKKTKAVEVPATETPSAPIAEAEPVVKPKSKAKSTEKEAAPLETEKKAAPTEKLQEPTFEEIQLQAYFIAERRARLGVPGDAASDWVEAEAVLKEQLASK
jgi:hypothetical protein